MRHEGRAENAGDILLICTGGAAGSNVSVNFQVFLNTLAASNLTNASTGETEALLLIDEPQPSPAVNTSNGFPYTGQVKGTPGVPAGAPGSGNVYQAASKSINSFTWTGVPVVAPGAAAQRIIRFTNIRADARVVPIPDPLTPGKIYGYVAAASSGGPITVNNPAQIVAFVMQSLTFSSAVSGPLATLTFTEQFTTAMRTRMTSPGRQNVPGAVYFTESGFTPDFATLNPGDIGSANTGTRLAAFFTNIPAGVTLLLVPNSVTASPGSGLLRRILPPYGASYDGGTLAPATGYGAVLVVNQKTAVLYELIQAGDPLVMEQFKIQTVPWPAVALTGTTVQGLYAPINSTAGVNGPAPEPRFLP
ncbi:MAG: hypothetical protein ACE15B_25705 [Bryobacteraceae bacterium]